MVFAPELAHETKKASRITMPSPSHDARERRDSLCPGDVLVSKYRIERVLGEGGMCTVFAAEHMQLEDWVAIKVLHAEFVDRPDLVQRFLREGKLATRIRSEHVVRTFDVGTSDEGTPYLVMEYLVGSDLDALVSSKGPLPPRAAVDYVLQASEAIAEAHQLGIVHRDLKPANLFLTRRADGSPWIKVLDFGISKVIALGSRREQGLTGTQSVMGSPRYMSPEQMRSSRNVDARTDIWALGTILYELMAGAPPFEGESMPELCARILQTPTPPLSRACPKVPPALEAVVLRCLEKDPAKRYANMAELAFALRDHGTPAGRASANRIVGIMNAPANPVGTRPAGAPSDPAPAWGSTDPSWRPAPRKRRRTARALGLFVGSLAILASGAATGLYAMKHPIAKRSGGGPAPALSIFAMPLEPTPPDFERAEPAEVNLPSSIAAVSGLPTSVPAETASNDAPEAADSEVETEAPPKDPAGKAPARGAAAPKTPRPRAYERVELPPPAVLPTTPEADWAPQPPQTPEPEPDPTPAPSSQEPPAEDDFGDRK